MTSGTNGPDGTDPGGAVAQEAMRLAEAVSEWARSAHSNPDDARQGTESSQHSEPGDGGEASAQSTAGGSCGCQDSAAVGAVCGVCPICRMATIVQAIQPEVIERVADVLAMFAGSLHAVAEDRRRDDNQDREHDASQPSPAAEQPEGTQHTDIPVSGDPDGDGGPQ